MFSNSSFICGCHTETLDIAIMKSNSSCSAVYISFLIMVKVIVSSILICFNRPILFVACQCFPPKSHHQGCTFDDLKLGWESTRCFTKQKRQIYTQTDRQTDRQKADRQTDRQKADTQTDTQKDRQSERKTNRKTDR